MTARRGYFVTGTGTGVGKTFVTCGLARAARACGIRVFAFKPIETGCERHGEALLGADQELLCSAAGDWQQGALRGVYRFAPAIAPYAASLQANVAIDLESVENVLQEGEAASDLTLVEGAGGWRVPITSSLDMGGMAARIRLPIVVVAQASLGTINHSLLTLEAIERDGQVIAGLVLSKHPGDDPAFVAENVEQIALRWGGRIVVCSKPDDLKALL